MRIIALEATNVKALRAIRIVPTGSLTQITGANGAGKSSAADCVYYALGGKKALPSHPIRRGEESAEIKLDLGDIRVTRTFTGDKTDVFVEAQDGARYRSPQTLLEGLLTELGFDPLKFANADPKAQLEMLRALVKLDVDIDALDGLTERDRLERRDWNRSVASLKERVATLAGGIDAAMDTTPIDLEALTERMATASEHNAALDRIGSAIDALGREEKEAAEEAQDFRATAIRLRHEADEAEQNAGRCESTASGLREEICAAEAKLAEGVRVDVSGLRTEINDAMKTNAIREQQERQRISHQRAAGELTAASLMSENLTKAIEARLAERQAVIARANMPVPGLGFGDGQVLYNDLPLDQASQAERIRVSFAIAIAANPKLRVAFIRDGSLLDENNLALIAQMAEENDFQVFVERVDTSGKIGILIQDGEVTAIDGVPVEREAEPVGA